MDSFTRLPAEVHLEIGSYLPSQMDYYNLTLVCKRLRPIGEQLLYSGPDLRNRPGQTLLLARTVLSKPKLGKLTKALTGLSVQEISGRPDKWEHDPQGQHNAHNLTEDQDQPEVLIEDRSGWRNFPWPDGWSLTDADMATIEEVKGLTKKFLKDLGVAKDSSWMQVVDTDPERAVAGTLLAAMPNLALLDMGEWRHIQLPAQTLTDNEIALGKSDPSLITCLPSLRVFWTSGAIPWPLVSHFRNLTDICLNLFYHDSVAVGPKPEPSTPLLLESVVYFKLNLDVVIFMPQFDSKLVYVRDLLTMCPNVDTIVIEFQSTVPDVEEELMVTDLPLGEEGWEQILEALEPSKDSLRELDISTFDVISETGVTHEYFYHLQSWLTLHEFTKLETLYAPSLAFRDMSQTSVDEWKISLPASLTTLTIDSILADRVHTPWHLLGEKLLRRLDGETPPLTSLWFRGDLVDSDIPEEGVQNIRYERRNTYIPLYWSMACDRSGVMTVDLPPEVVLH